MRIVITAAKIILNGIYAVIKLLPIEDKITLVSRQGNSPSLDISMLRDEIRRQSPATEVVCLCRKIGDGAVEKIKYCFHLLRQMYHIGTSRAVAADSYCIGVSVLKQRKSVRIVQMWHALGALKKFGLSIAGKGGEGRDRRIAELMDMHANYTFILISSEKCREPYREAFGYGDESFRIASLPRVDAIFDEKFRERALKAIYDAYPALAGKKTVVYAPTFRKGKDISREIMGLAGALDMDKYVLVVKKHPLMEFSGDLGQVIEDDKFSTLEMLFAADYVVLDYSAVVFEAALMKKPLFFYNFDMDEYAGNRGFYLDYEKDMPGVVSPSPERIAKAIEENEFDLEKIERFAGEYVRDRENCTFKLARLMLSK